MPSRDDHESLETRRAELRQKLAEADRTAAELQAATERSTALEAELADIDARLAHRKGRRLPLLDGLRIASPCDASWDLMLGDERVRFCEACQKSVYNLSAMTRAEAEALLVEREGSLCVRMYQRADGTVITTDCPEGVRRRRRRTAFAMAGAGAMAASAAFAALRQPVPPTVARPQAAVDASSLVTVGMGAPTAVPDVPSIPVVTGPAPPVQGGIRYVPRDRGKVTVPKRTKAR